MKTNFSYTQPWWLPGTGFLFLHTHYNSGSEGSKGVRGLHWMTSADGVEWTKPKLLANIEMGDYQVSWPYSNTVSTAFDFHPKPGGLNARANIYFLQTSDAGKTWKTVDGKEFKTPALDNQQRRLDFGFTAGASTRLLEGLELRRQRASCDSFPESKGYESGPKNSPRIWKTARWTGSKWEVRDMTTSGSNYDHGSLYIEPDGTWRVIAPTTGGPTTLQSRRRNGDVDERRRRQDVEERKTTDAQ